jgi:hypothetical protein
MFLVFLFPFPAFSQPGLIPAFELGQHADSWGTSAGGNSDPDERRKSRRLCETGSRNHPEMMVNERIFSVGG